MSRVVHFEFSAIDPERAGAFYKEAFGWDIQKWEGPEPYWLVNTGQNGEPGINGGIFVPKQEGFIGTVNTIEVSSVDEFMEKVEQNGGKVVTEKMTIPGMGYLAYFQDTEGNIMGITQFDPSAK